MSKDTINPKRYTVVEKLGKDVKEGEEIYRHTTGWEAWGKDDSFAAFNQGTTFLCRVPSSPVMDFQEFIGWCVNNKNIPYNKYTEDEWACLHEGYLIGTRSIVPEISDNEIEKECINRKHEFQNGSGDDWERGARWYREQIRLRSQINK